MYTHLYIVFIYANVTKDVFVKKKNHKDYNGGKSRKCLLCRRVKPTCSSRSLQ